MPIPPGSHERYAPKVISDVRATHCPYGTAYEQMLERVRSEGAYPTRERADEAVHLVLAGLGRQLTATNASTSPPACPWRPHAC